MFDLLGSVAAAEGTGGTTISDALRTDAYGQTIGLYPAGGSSLPVRFRGLIDSAPTADPDVAGAGADALYVMGARSYSPHLGTFTALDTYAGRAQDAASLNRYLYAHANPATLIDPDGHRVCEADCDGNPTAAEIKRAKQVAAATGTANGSVSPPVPTSPTTSTGTNYVAGGGFAPLDLFGQDERSPLPALIDVLDDDVLLSPAAKRLRSFALGEAWEDKVEAMTG